MTYWYTKNMFGTFPSLEVTIWSRRSQVTGCDTLSVSLVLPNTITFATYFTVICILFCTTNFREHYLVVLQLDIFGQEKVRCLESGTNQAQNVTSQHNQIALTKIGLCKTICKSLYYGLGLA